MKRAARTNDGDPSTDMVVRCSNAQRSLFNEAGCKISYHVRQCQCFIMYMKPKIFIP